MHYYLYILHSDKLDRYYVGISSDPENRLGYHNTLQKGWTVRGRPWQLVYQREFADRIEAGKYERWLKRQKSRALLQKIVAGEFDWSQILFD